MSRSFRFPRFGLRSGSLIVLGGLVLAGCADARTHVRVPETRMPMSPPVNANSERFADWLTAFRLDAMKAGISAATFDRAMRGVTPDPDVMEADQNQPEFVKPVWEYLRGALSDKRVARGKALLAENRTLFDRIEKTYGVDRHFVAAIWGLESNFGDHMGTQSVVRSLATLGFEGRRPDFGRTQLIAALQIVQAGDIPPEEMVGSWAGAMGQTQFIPTTYLAHAIDFDGDGRRDIWRSTADTLASTAHYLQVSKWQTGGHWGFEVAMPKHFDYALADMSLTKTVAEWKKLGLKRADGRAFPATDVEEKASLLLPAGYKGPAFLVLNNFRSILVYNASTSYALAVSLLADRFVGRGEIKGGWPYDERPLTRSEREELQALLTAKGYDHGKPDGIIGYNTRKAIRAYQQSVGLPPDGYPTASLLERMRAN
ncbi:lytic murein transglycosylase [Parvibaculum sedimenti]|uniref:Lytic murein transglycosylase n=1 Tax=Parvibaculum sedimenti TaxID=2608632 RepID=A0A6N6VIG5_9HYPH|nr:lytic murein transglycosylase [Parvibaculum sedimenti]KAB7740681.1 lytic murein transglycosylase [Parvibaculum sedimenti]